MDALVKEVGDRGKLKQQSLVSEGVSPEVAPTRLIRSLAPTPAPTPAPSPAPAPAPAPALTQPLAPQHVSSASIIKGSFEAIAAFLDARQEKTENKIVALLTAQQEQVQKLCGAAAEAKAQEHAKTLREKQLRLLQIRLDSLHKAQLLTDEELFAAGEKYLPLTVCSNYLCKAMIYQGILETNAKKILKMVVSCRGYHCRGPCALEWRRRHGHEVDNAQRADGSRPSICTPNPAEVCGVKCCIARMGELHCIDPNFIVLIKKQAFRLATLDLCSWNPPATTRI